jgi:membrane protein required for colicin V production
MNPVDLVIILLLLLSAFWGFRTGLIQCIATLVGLIFGIAFASWYFKHLSNQLEPYIRNTAISEAAAFFLIAMLVMVVAGLIGMVLKKIIHGVGLGFVDRILGTLFGFLQGALLVTLFIVALAAFFPDTRWLGNAKLSKYFLGSVHLTTQITPGDLKQRILGGLHELEKDTPSWLHPQ